MGFLDGEYRAEEMPPAARHMVWSECYAIYYSYPKLAESDGLEDWVSGKEIVHHSNIEYMAWVEVDEEDWINSLGDPEDWEEITIERIKSSYPI